MVIPSRPGHGNSEVRLLFDEYLRACKQLPGDSRKSANIELDGPSKGEKGGKNRKTVFGHATAMVRQRTWWSELTYRGTSWTIPREECRQSLPASFCPHGFSSRHASTRRQTAPQASSSGASTVYEILVHLPDSHALTPRATERLADEANLCRCCLAYGSRSPEQAGSQTAATSGWSRSRLEPRRAR